MRNHRHLDDVIAVFNRRTCADCGKPWGLHAVKPASTNLTKSLASWNTTVLELLCPNGTMGHRLVNSRRLLIAWIGTEVMGEGEALLDPFQPSENDELVDSVTRKAAEVT